MLLVSQRSSMRCPHEGQNPAGAAESGRKGACPELRRCLPLFPAHRYVQSLLDIMVFLDKDPEDQRTLSQ